MVAATASFVTNDTLMKLATAGLPPYEVLVLRGVSATLWAVPVLLVLKLGGDIPSILRRSLLLRNGLEVLGILSFIVALAHMPIADATALGQITPLLVLLGASLMFGETLGWVRGMLVRLGFTGAVMVAQPSREGLSVFALLALANAVFSAGRDIASRRVATGVPGLVVAFGAIVMVLVGAGIAHIALEDWTTPSSRHLLLLGAAGLFLLGGHFCLFMAYRVGPASTVAPFFYFFTVWAVISGVLVFGQFPNRLALAGMLLVVLSGVAVLILDQRRRRRSLAP